MSFRRAVDWLLRDRRTGRIVIAQMPNAPLIVFIGASLVRRLIDPAGSARTFVSAVALLSLAWWSLDEVVRGVNPFRRMLGAAVLAATTIGVVR